MITKDQINDLIEPVLDNNMFIVDIQVAAGNKITVLIDTPEGITLDHCALISRTVEKSLNRDVEDFEIEVSSPGLTQPLKVIQQYHKNIGKEVEILKKDGIKFKGFLTGVAENGIDVEVEKFIKLEGAKKKEKVVEKQFLEFDKIKHTKLVLSFK